MIVRFSSVAERGARRSSRQRAFTLPEVMIAMTVFLMVMAGVVVSNLFGIRMVEATRPKLDAGDETRQLYDRLSAEISSAKAVWVGSGNAASFTPFAFGTTRQGNAIKIQLGTNTSSWIRYFRDSGDGQLKRMTNGGSATLVTSALNNSLVFTEEDFNGGVLTYDQNNWVLGVNLQYTALEGGAVPMGSNRYFKSYQVQLKIARRER